MRRPNRAIVVLVALATLTAPAAAAASLTGTSLLGDDADPAPSLGAWEENPFTAPQTAYEAIRENPSAPDPWLAWEDERRDELAHAQAELADQLLRQIDSSADATGPQTALELARTGLEQRRELVDGESTTLEASLDAQQDRLDAAEELWSLARSDPGNGGDAFEMARRATAMQAATLSLEPAQPVPLTGYDRPSQALAELADRHGVDLDPAQIDELRSLDELPEPVASNLARVVDAYLALDTATQAAYPSDGSPIQPMASTDRTTTTDGLGLDDRWVSSTPGERLEEAGVELAPVLTTRARLLGAIMGLRGTVQEHAENLTQPCDAIQVPPAFSIDVTRCDNTYEQDYALQIDVGGEDTYENNAGGSRCGLILSESGALVDLGLSEDQYGDSENPRSCGVNGGGGTGVGFLFDDGGSDAYVAGDLGTNGGGTGTGLGFLLDAGRGEDTYTAGGRGTNGGGFLNGFGLLIDAGLGETTYEAGSAGTNGGGEIGVGFLVDAGGPDNYDAGFLGTNGAGAVGNGQGLLLDAGGSDTYVGVDATNGAGSAGGRGLLFDAGIDEDTYSAGTVSNGGGGFFGVGTLLDTGGDDEYNGASATNGGGGLGGVGLLVDTGTGDDAYEGQDGAANGGAVVVGAGLLLDASPGDDTYTAGGVGTNGGSFFAAVGFLLDSGIGDDRYQAGAEGTNGGGNLSVGSLRDTGGEDAYADPLLPGGSCMDCTVVPKDEAGSQVDLVRGCLIGPAPLGTASEACVPPGG